MTQSMLWKIIMMSWLI